MANGDPYVTFRLIALALILLCSSGLFYFAAYVNKLNGDLIRERDELKERVHELEKKAIAMKVELEMIDDYDKERTRARSRRREED